MSESAELIGIVRRMLEAIHAGDLETYTALSSPELTCFETDVAPYRIDGLDFHLRLMDSMRESGSFGKLVGFEMLTPHVHLLGDSAVVTYTRLMTYSTESGPVFRAFNETRVFTRKEGGWRMIHFHRSHAAV